MDSILIAVAVITGLTEVVKRAGVSTRYIPLIAVVFGIIYALAFSGLEAESVVQGIIAGLTSVGLYRAGQKIME